MDSETELKHLREAARLLSLCVRIDSGDVPDQELLTYSLDLANWLDAEEKRQKAMVLS